MIDQIIEYNIMSPLLGDGYKAGGIGGIKTHPLVPKDIVVRGFIIDSETGGLEEIIDKKAHWARLSELVKEKNKLYEYDDDFVSSYPSDNFDINAEELE